MRADLRASEARPSRNLDLVEHKSLAADVEHVADRVLITEFGGTIRCANPSFTAMTGYRSQEDALRSKEISFAAYLVKPVRQSDLFDCLAAVLAGERQKETLTPRHSLQEARRRDVRILVAEDNLTNQEVAVGMLRRMGWSADVAGDGKQAVQALETRLYDLVLMDIQMPEMDGYEATRMIRDSASSVLNHNVPIIALTAREMAGDVEKCIAVGMSGYIAKPIDAKILAKVVEEWLTRKVHCVTTEGSLELTADSTTSQRKPQDVSQVFNREAFLQRMMGDEEFAREIVADFVKQLPTLVGALKDQIEVGSLDGIWKQAHRVKGSAANVGGEALRDVALAMEQAGKAGDLGRVVLLIPELETQTVQVGEALQRWTH